MNEILLEVIENLSLLIGLIGILVILIGASKALYDFFAKPDTEDFQQVRLTLGAHVILGLDFLVGKDIIDTLLLDVHDWQIFWMELTSLITVVVIRIVLNYFMLKEIHQIEATKLIMKEKAEKEKKLSKTVR